MGCQALLVFGLTVLSGHAVAIEPHPRIFVSSQALSRIRTAVSDPAAKPQGNTPAAVWRAVEEKADRFADAPPYRYTVEIPGREGGPSKTWSYALSDAPPPRHDDSPHFPVWTAMFQERGDSITTRLQYFLTAWVISGEARYFEKAKEIVWHLCSWPGIWTDPSYGGGRPALDTSHAAVWVGIFYDWCHDRLSSKERTRIQAALTEKALVPLSGRIGELAAYHNFAAVTAAGLGIGAIALLGEEPRAQEWVNQALAKARSYLDAQGQDGAPLEGAVYGTYAAEGLADLLWALDSAGITHELWSHPYLEALPRYCVSLLDLGTKTQPTFGDGNPTPGFGRVLTLLALRGNAEAAWYCERIGALREPTPRNLLALGRSPIRATQPTGNPSRAFPSAGYAVLRDGYRDDTPFLAFKVGPEGRTVGHNHFDHNSFQLSYGGEWIASDPGYRSYFNPAERRYSVGTLGHNTVILDLDPAYLRNQAISTPGKDQVHLDRAKIAEFFAGEDFDYVRGQAAASYNPDGVRVLDRFDRQIVFAKPGIFFVRDTFEAPQPHTYSLLFHLPPGGTFEVSAGSARASGRKSLLEVHPFCPLGITLTEGAYTGAERLGPYMTATTRRAKSATVTTVMIPRRHRIEVQNPSFEEGLSGWQIRDKEGSGKNHVLDTAIKRFGKASARIDNSGYYYSARLPISPGTRVTGRSWARSTAPAGGGRVSLIYWRGGKNVGRIDGPRGQDGDWAPLEATGVVPEGADEVSLALEFFGKGSCWFDDAELVTDQRAGGTALGRVTPLKDGVSGATAEVDGVTYVLLCGESGIRREVKAVGRRFATDAEVAAMSLKDANAAALLIRGTYLEMDGQRLAASPGMWQIRDTPPGP